MVDFLDYYVGDGEEPAPMPRRKILSTVKTKKRKDRTNKKASATGSRLTPNHVLVVDQKRKHSPSIQDHFFDLAIALKQSHCLAAQQAGLFNWAIFSRFGGHKWAELGGWQWFSQTVASRPSVIDLFPSIIDRLSGSTIARSHAGTDSLQMRSLINSQPTNPLNRSSWGKELYICGRNAEEHWAWDQHGMAWLIENVGLRLKCWLFAPLPRLTKRLLWEVLHPGNDQYAIARDWVPKDRGRK